MYVLLCCAAKRTVAVCGLREAAKNQNKDEAWSELQIPSLTLNDLR